MMKKPNKFINLFRGLALLLILIITSCKDELDGTTFFTSDDMTIMATLESSPEKFSMYTELVKKSDFANALNSFGSYTCFAPNNEAVTKYISEKFGVTTVAELNTPEQLEFVNLLVKFQTTSRARLASTFIEGRIPDTTYTGDFLTTSFLSGGGIANIKINRDAGFDQFDIEANNGVIHALNTVLDPYVDPVPRVMENRGEHTIFVEAMKQTGLYETFSVIFREGNFRRNFTIFAESDEVYAKEGINSFEDLLARVSPDNNDYKSELNNLNRYVGYHATENFFYTSDIPENGLITTVLENNAIKSDIKEDELRINTLKDGVTWTSLIIADSNYPAKNGVYHTVNKFFPIFIPLAERIQFDFSSGQPEVSSGEITHGDLVPPTAYEFVRWQPDTQNLRILSGGNRVSLGRNVIDAHSFSWIEFDTPIIPRGKYEMRIVGNMSRSGRGTLQAHWDGEPIGPVWDMTSAFSHGWPDEAVMLTNNFRLGDPDIANNAGVTQAEQSSNSKFILAKELIISEQKRHIIRLENVRSGVTPLDFIEWVPVEE